MCCRQKEWVLLTVRLVEVEAAGHDRHHRIEIQLTGSVVNLMMMIEIGGVKSIRRHRWRKTIVEGLG